MQGVTDTETDTTTGGINTTANAPAGERGAGVGVQADPATDTVSVGRAGLRARPRTTSDPTTTLRPPCHLGRPLRLVASTTTGALGRMRAAGMDKISPWASNMAGTGADADATRAASVGHDPCQV